MPPDAQPTLRKTLDCELCIVGAGYAALNGLNAAAKYLRKGDRVVIIDKNSSWGGQWLNQYDFVRLHQPYRMFTAGDQPWMLARHRSHLATRSEVLDHLASVPQISAGHLEIVPLFGHAYRGHRVHEGRAEVDVTPVAIGSSDATSVRVRARRLLKATGADIQILEPFRLSSPRVRSVAVADPVLMTPEFLDSTTPVYIIGSGKTAMDCVRHIKQRSRAKDRQVNVLTGSGMWFFVRDSFFPSGARRFTGGRVVGDVFVRVARLFDGENALEVVQDLERVRLSMNVFGYGGNCRYGFLSLAERDEIRRGIHEAHRGHLVDVDGNRLVLREGDAHREVRVPDGSWFINCTAHLRALPHEPVLQDSGAVCAPQSVLAFSGTSAYFITHLWYRNQLAEVAPELFRVDFDVEPKLKFMPQMAVMFLANLGLILPRLPASVPSKFLGDFNKWYPLHRQLLALARLTTQREPVRHKAERILRLRFSDSPETTAASAFAR